MVAKFKIGDIVRCTFVEGNPIYRRDMGDEWSDIYGYGWVLNKTFKITKISNLDGLSGSKLEPIYWDSNYGVYEIALELVKKQSVQVYGIVKFLESINVKV